MEQVDILTPPTFKKSWVVKTLTQAWDDEDWIGTFNLWIIQEDPVPSIVYQMRSPKSSWAPNKLDVTAGGHYSAWEERRDWLREVREELGKDYAYEDIDFIGRKMHVGPDTKGRMRKNIVDIFFVRDNARLDSYVLEEAEVYWICVCPISELLKVHSIEWYGFSTTLLRNDGLEESINVTKNSFPFNWDDYHFKIAVLADRYIRKESFIMY